MQPDVNSPDVSGRSQTPELFGLVQNGLFETCSTRRCLYRENIPCYKWTCSLSGACSDALLPGNRKSSPENAFLRTRILRIRKRCARTPRPCRRKLESTSDKSTKHK